MVMGECPLFFYHLLTQLFMVYPLCPQYGSRWGGYETGELVAPWGFRSGKGETQTASA